MSFVFDANGAIVGRLASEVAKLLLKGEKVIVINAEKAIISGDKQKIILKYKARRAVIQKANPEHAPHWPRRPDLLLRRIIRGMLPFDSARGRDAFKRLRVYLSVPEKFKDQIDKIDKTKEDINKKEIKTKYITILDLCKELGWRV